MWSTRKTNLTTLMTQLITKMSFNWRWTTCNSLTSLMLVWHFWSSELDLDPMILICEFDLDTVKLKMKFLGQGFQKLQHEQDRQTDTQRQTICGLVVTLDFDLNLHITAKLQTTNPNQFKLSSFNLLRCQNWPKNDFLTILSPSWPWPLTFSH